MAEKPTLLIVDDEKPTRDGLRAALEDHYEVWVAEDAKAAVQKGVQGIIVSTNAVPSSGGQPLAIEVLGTIVLVHGANGWLFTNKGGGWEYPAFWTVGLIVLYLLGDGPLALRPGQRDGP